jgi:UDP-N-acetyl-D-glucosamine/UDP-N-acetyl-D-galactosamine dehydrogenase
MKIVVVGLGYVGLPLAIQLAKYFEVWGFDIDAGRIAELQSNHDRTREVDGETLAASTLRYAGDPTACPVADAYIVTVPTPIDAANKPDLRPVISATRTVAGMIDPSRRSVIVYESTVYPGVTEEVCGPLIEKVSGLKQSRDFFLGYSPERINPGDREHTVDRITKVIAGETPEITERLAAIYGPMTTGGVFRAASIRAAEAAKVIENAQRDINIAFINEATQIFSKMDLSIWDVLEAANTKWNFLPFQPGLVGGHCIGVDPYYLSHQAQVLGHDPQVILAGRITNDGMGQWIVDRIDAMVSVRNANILVLGLTFKENVPDLRNSKVVDVIRGLEAAGHSVTVHDPVVDKGEALHEYAIALDAAALDATYDVVVAAVAHDQYRAMDYDVLQRLVKPGGLLADLKRLWTLDADQATNFRYWTL